MGQGRDTLDDLPLSTRAKNALRSVECFGLEDLAVQREGFLDEAVRCGPTTRREITAFLESSKIKLRSRLDAEASFRLERLLSRMVKLENELNSTRGEVRQLLETHPDLDWRKA